MTRSVTDSEAPEKSGHLGDKAGQTHSQALGSLSPLLCPSHSLPCEARLSERGRGGLCFLSQQEEMTVGGEETRGPILSGRARTHELFQRPCAHSGHTQAPGLGTRILLRH